jgi:mono/diheme cytochrome c family protein
MSANKHVLVAAGLAAAVAAVLSGAAGAGSEGSLVGSKVDNFMLADQSGMGHELYYYTASPAIVLVASADGDKVSARAATALAKVRDAFKGKNVQFMMLDSSLNSPRGTFVGKPGSAELPVLADELQLVGRALGVTTTSEVFVVETKTWTVAYHGPIDDSFAQKKNKKANLTAALNAVLEGTPVPVAEAAVKGTPVDFPDRRRTAEFAKIDYSTQIAPILADKCVTCHTQGGLGPFAMNSYDIVQGFAPMIREVLRTKRMPPYHSDTHGSIWTDDMRLTDAQIKTIVNWVEAGAPRGEGPDPLPEAAKPAPKWPLGEPDVVVKIPAFNVPETGIVDYQDRSVATQTTEGKWLRATAWANATPTVHHALAGWIPKVDPNGRGFSWNVALGGYGPGGAPNLTPADTGIFLPPGGSYAYQMHYTPIGKPVTDQTEVGYYFYKEQPKYILRQASITDFSLEIPAGESRHQETAYIEFPHDAEVFGVQPHCHSRCYSTKLRIRYPDGTEKVLLNQPRYYFSWQREYHFKDLLDVPKGSLRADLRGDAVHVRALPLQGRDGRRAPRRVVPGAAAERHVRRAGRQHRLQVDGGGIPQRSALQAGRRLPADGGRRQGRCAVEGRDGECPADHAQDAPAGSAAGSPEAGCRCRGDEAAGDGRKLILSSTVGCDLM